MQFELRTMRDGQYDALNRCPTKIEDMEIFEHFLYGARALASVPPF